MVAHNPVTPCPAHPDKVRYRSKKLAKQALSRIGVSNRGLIHPYRCDGCDHWHIGHKRGSSSKRWGHAA